MKLNESLNEGGARDAVQVGSSASNVSMMFALRTAVAALAISFFGACAPPLVAPHAPVVSTPPAIPSTSELSSDEQATLRKALMEAESCFYQGTVNDGCEQLKPLMEDASVLDGRATTWLIEIAAESTRRGHLALTVLAATGQRYPTDAVLARRLVDVAEARAEAASDDSSPCDLGQVLARIDPEVSPDIEARLKALATGTAAPCMRQQLLAAWAGHVELSRFVLAEAKTGARENRGFAVEAFMRQPKFAISDEERCALFTAVQNDHASAPSAAEFAAMGAARSCEGARVATLKNIETWAVAGQLHEYGMGASLRLLFEAVTDEALRARCLEIALEILQNEDNNIVARESSLRFLWQHSPDKYRMIKEFAKAKRSRIWAVANRLQGYGFPHDVHLRALASHGRVADQPRAWAVEQAMWQRVGELRTCYEHARSAAGTLDVTLSIRFDYGPDGSLTNLRGFPEDLDVALRQCIVSHMSEVRAPAGREVGGSLSVELRFAPR